MSARNGSKNGILGRSASIEQAARDARRAASASGAVLILGERGTGKELFARLIHESSPRARKPLVVVNCASLNPDLADSLLFGHVRGAFTGAVGARGGFVGAAEGGTLFLDEVGELPVEVQARLLRLLQEKAVVSVGEYGERKVDVRVIAATNRDLHAMAREGHFREDLLDRLRVWEVHLPPLRQRKDDLREIAEDWLRRAPDLVGRALRLGRSAVAALRAHDWPGNVRELQRVLVRASALVGEGDVLGGRHVHEVLAQERGAELPAARPAVDLVFAALRVGERVGMGELVERTGLPRSTLKAAVGRLMVSGRLGRTGGSRGTRYWRAEGTDSVGPAEVMAHPLAMAILDRLGATGPTGCLALAQALRVSSSTALRALGALVDAGLVTRSGVARATRYALVGRDQAVASSPPTVPAELPPPSPVPPRPTPDLDQIALDLARARGALARRELVRMTGASPRSALRSLARLAASGQLIALGGRGCGCRYGIPGRALDPQPASAARPRDPRALKPEAPRAPPRNPGAELALAVALVVALQHGRVHPAQLERRAGVPLAYARASLDALAERGLLLPVGDAYALAPPDPLLDTG